MVPIIWHSDELSVTRFFVLVCTFSSHSEYVERKYYFSTFLNIYITEYQIQRKTKKIVGERTSTFCVLWYRHDNFYCAGMVIFTLRIIFLGVLRKCYKITVPRSNFYLEFPYSLRRTFCLRVPFDDLVHY